MKNDDDLILALYDNVVRSLVGNKIEYRLASHIVERTWNRSVEMVYHWSSDGLEQHSTTRKKTRFKVAISDS